MLLKASERTVVFCTDEHGMISRWHTVSCPRVRTDSLKGRPSDAGGKVGCLPSETIGRE
jgi:hypothetical protein